MRSSNDIVLITENKQMCLFEPLVNCVNENLINAAKTKMMVWGWQPFLFG